MGLIEPQQAQHFIELLTRTLSSQNVQRREAELELENLAEINLDSLALALIHTMRFCDEPQLRSYASVLFRRLIVLPIPHENQVPDKDPVRFSGLLPNNKETVKSQLIMGLRNEENRTCRSSLCDVTSDLYIYLETIEKHWHELPGLIVELCNQAPGILRESGFKIISTYPNIIKDNKMNSIGKAFNLTSDRDEPSVRLSVLNAYVALLINAEKPRHDMLVPYLPQMFKILEPFYLQKDEDSLWTGISYFIELTETKSYLLIKYLPNILKFCTIIMKDKELYDSPRFVALEFLLNIVEFSSTKARSYPELFELLVPILLEWMSNFNDFEGWYSFEDDSEEQEEESFMDTGYNGIDRLARAIGGKYFMPLTFEHITRLANSENWQYRHAAVSTIGALSDGCSKYMLKRIEHVLNFILPTLQDPHPRVRHAAVNTIGLLALEFQEDFVNNYHSLFVPSILPLLDDSSVPRLQAHAAASLHNVFEVMDKDITKNYLDTVLNRLIPLLKNGIQNVQEETLSAIASIADSAEEAFAKYYQEVMPLLINLVESSNQPDQKMLRAKAVEAISLIVLVLGLDYCTADVEPVISFFIKIQSTPMDPDDPMVSYLLQAWTRIAMLMGKHFAPYLEHVMPEIIKSILIKPEIVVLEPTEDPEEQYPAEQGWEFSDSHGKLVGVKTSILEDKSAAIEMVLSFAQSLQASFAEYATELFPSIIPLTNYIIHPETRSASIRAIPHLLYSIKDAGAPQEEIIGLAQEVYIPLFRQLRNEEEPDLFNLVLSTFADVVDLVDSSSLTSAHVTRFVKEIHTHLTQSIKSLAHFTIQTLRPNYDEEEMDPAILQGAEYDEEFMNLVSKALHDIIRLHGPQFFRELLPVTTTAISAFDCPNSTVKRWTLGLFDDIVRFGGHEATTFYNGVFVEPMIRSLLDNSVDVRQAAAYGVGLWAEYGGDEYIPCCAKAVPNLVSAIQDPSANSIENVFATDNAVSALAKIILYKGASLPVEQIYMPFIRALPIRSDRDEFNIVYGLAARLLGNPPPSLRSHNEALELLAKALMVALVEVLLDGPILYQAKEALKKYHQQFPEAFKGIIEEFKLDGSSEILNNIMS